MRHIWMNLARTSRTWDLRTAMDKVTRTVLVSITFLLLVSAAMRLAQDVVLAQSGDEPSVSLETGYDLSWWTVDSGGSTPAGDGYTLAGTIGQPDAGSALSDGGYTLTGGFWVGGAAAAADHRIYLPLVLRLYVTP